MGQLSKEFKGKAKIAAGTVSGNDDLRHEGEIENEEAVQQDNEQRAHDVASTSGSEGITSEDPQQPGMSDQAP